LLEIGRLQEELRQSHELRELEVNKARREFEKTSHLQVSQIRQNQYGQAEVFELQIRRLKEQLTDKQQEVQKAMGLLEREKESNEREKNRFKDEVRLLIEKKNAEIYELKQDSDSKLRDFELERTSELEEIKYACNKEVSNLSKELEKHQDELKKLK
jgi:hypothetical protein